MRIIHLYARTKNFLLQKKLNYWSPWTTIASSDFSIIIRIFKFNFFSYYLMYLYYMDHIQGYTKFLRYISLIHKNCWIEILNCAIRVIELFFIILAFIYTYKPINQKQNCTKKGLFFLLVISNSRNRVFKCIMFLFFRSYFLCNFL